MNPWKSRMLAASVLLATASLGRGQSAPSDTPAPAAPPAAPATTDRAYLGVYIEGEADGGGVKLADVAEGSPAAKAGLQAGDVITTVGDRTVGNEDELRDAIASHQAGEKVKLTFLRDGEKRRTSARLAKAPVETAEENEEHEGQEHEGQVHEGQVHADVKKLEEKVAATQQALERRVQHLVEEKKAEAAKVAAAPAGGDSSGYMGVMLAPTDDGKAKVNEVVAGSPAEKFGLQAGDVITQIDGNDVGSVEDLVAAVQAHHAGDKVALAVQRNGETMKLKVKLGTRSATGMPGMPGATIAVPVAPAEVPAPPAPPATESRPMRVRGRIPGGGAEAGGAPEMMQKQMAEMRAQLDAMRAEMEALRERCEKQQRTLEMIRRALNGEPGPQSMAAPTPGSGGGMASFTGSGMAAPGEISFTTGSGQMLVTAPGSEGGGAAGAGNGIAIVSAGGDAACCAATPAADGATAVATGDGNGLVLNFGGGDGGGDGQPMVFTIGDGGEVTSVSAGDGQPMTMTGTLNLSSDGTVQGLTLGDGAQAGQHVIRLGDGNGQGGIEFKLDGLQIQTDDAKPHGGKAKMKVKRNAGDKTPGAMQFKIEGAGDGHSLQLVPANGDGSGNMQIQFEGGSGLEQFFHVAPQHGDAKGGGHAAKMKGNGTFEIQIDGDGSLAHAKVAKLQDLVLEGNSLKAMKVRKLAGKPMKAQALHLGDGQVKVMIVDEDGEKCESGQCEEQECEGQKCEEHGGQQCTEACQEACEEHGQGGTCEKGGSCSMMGGGMGMGPGHPAPMAGCPIFQALAGPGSFKFRCDGPVSFRFGPDGGEFRCEGACEFSKDGGGAVRCEDGNVGAGILKMLGEGGDADCCKEDGDDGEHEDADDDDDGGHEDGDDDDDDDDDDGAAAKPDINVMIAL